MATLIRRRHSHAGGEPKVKFTSWPDARAAAAAMETDHGVHFSAYKCSGCDFFHVGKDAKWRRQRYDVALLIEIGDRAHHNMKRENKPTPLARRVAAIRTRCR